MLNPLLVDLDLDLMLLTQILKLTFFVSQLCLFVLELLFPNDPEIVNSLTLVLIETSQVFFLSDLCFERTALDT